MKRLYLVRHAATNKILGQNDLSHHLTNAGIDEADKLAEYIHHKDYHIQKIFTSTAMRTRETAHEVIKDLPYHPQMEIDSRIYNCSDNDLANFISNIDDSLKAVMIVGHNPSITSVMNLLRPQCTLEQARVAFNMDYTAKLVAIELTCDKWQQALSSSCKIIDVYIPSLNA